MGQNLLDQIPENCRGIIVADASGLKNLDATVDPKRLNPGFKNAPQKYLDLLESLANQGL